nr:MFS transporter [Propionibacterium cyclohexanicum]
MSLGIGRVSGVCSSAPLSCRCWPWAVSSVRGVWAWRLGVPLVALLVGYAVIAAVIDGFRSPSELVFIRQFVEPEDVPRAMSVSSTLGTVATLAGPGLGGLLIAWGGLPAPIVFDIVTFLLVIGVLVRLHPRHELTGNPSTGNTLTQLREGLSALRRHRSGRALVASLVLVAGGLLPVTNLLVPLLARSRAWSAGATGAIVMASTAGTVLVSAALAIFGPLHRAQVALVAGVGLACFAVAAMAVLPSSWAVGGAAFLLGAGLMVFSGHLSPLFVLLTPAKLQSRFASVLVMAQMMPAVVTNLLLGTLTQRWGTPLALGCCAILGLAGTVPLLACAPLRQARLGASRTPAEA